MGDKRNAAGSSGDQELDHGRRSALRWLAAAAPAVAVLGSGASAADAPPEKPKLSGDARFIVKQEPGLTGGERKRLEKQLPGLEGALKKIRDFDLPDEVEPAFTFRALRAPGGRR